MSSVPWKRVSPSEVRFVTDQDFSAIRSSVFSRTSSADGRKRLVSQVVDIEYVTNRIVTGEIPAVILKEQILICYGVGTPWYSNTPLLQELMVLRLHPGKATLADVDAVLMDLCDAAGAEGILVGGALSTRPRVLARAYRQLGYVEQDHPELFKWRK